jgi:uncharacterized protein YggE
MNTSKRIFLTTAAMLLLVALLSAAPIAAQTARPPQERIEPRLITTTGEAEVLVIPDEVVLTLGVETSNRQLSLAKRENDEIVAKVLAAAQARGVAAKYLQTDHISIEPRYRDSYEQRDFVGYFVRKTIVITLKDISAFDAVLTDALEAGAAYVHGIQFRTTELRKHRDKARVLAIRAAHEKAVALAQELGQEVGQPHDIREDQSGWWSWYNSWWGSRASTLTQNVIQEGGGAAPVATEGTLAPGQISVTARVTVIFELK